MKIELNRIQVRDVVIGYRDDSANEGPVVGYDGKLDIRPAFQREFVYDAKKREAVLQTVMRGFPLNVMYWSTNNDGESFEVLDGQQRTISICQYVKSEFSITIDGRPMYFHNLTQAQKDRVLGYELMIYFCEGDDQEKLSWFKTINIAGEKLTDQELRNAVYTGPWLSHAKSIFSKTNGAAYGLASKYVAGSPIRQELLETALDWKSKGEIDEYMARNQNKQNANELWLYFQKVIGWVQLTFPHYRKEMKAVEWGPLYDDYGEDEFDTAELEARVVELMKDPDVTKRRGIYPYLLTGNERHLSIRQFDDRDKRAAYERQRGLCANGEHCKTPNNTAGDRVFDIGEMQADHITPWSQGGKTTPDNCQMLCTPCNRDKSGI